MRWTAAGGAVDQNREVARGGEGRRDGPQKDDADIKAADYALTPGRYVGAPELEDDGEPIEEKLGRLRGELLASFDESARLEKIVRQQMERLDG